MGAPKKLISTFAATVALDHRPILIQLEFDTPLPTACLEYDRYIGKASAFELLDDLLEFWRGTAAFRLFIHRLSVAVDCEPLQISLEAGVDDKARSSMVDKHNSLEALLRHAFGYLLLGDGRRAFSDLPLFDCFAIAAQDNTDTVGAPARFSHISRGLSIDHFDPIEATFGKDAG